MCGTELTLLKPSRLARFARESSLSAWRCLFASLVVIQTRALSAARYARREQGCNWVFCDCMSNPPTRQRMASTRAQQLGGYRAPKSSLTREVIGMFALRTATVYPCLPSALVQPKQSGHVGR